MKQIVRLLREPLFHFLALGGLLFAIFAAVSAPAPAPALTNNIVIGQERTAQLAIGFEAVWKRSPSDQELRALIDNFVREEVYYREALALGLDRNDTVIRRRLQQKMEFLTDLGADFLEPETDELEAYYQVNGQRYQEAPRVAFEQIFLGQRATPERIATALAAVQSNTETDPHRWGERTLLPPQMALSIPNAIDGTFGTGFYDTLKEIPVDNWVGPVESGYGVHLVRIVENSLARTPPLAEVRDAVLRDWRVAKALELRELNYAKLRERYVIEILDSEPAPTAAQ